MFSAAHLDRLGSKFKTAIGLRGRGESAFGMLARSGVEGAVTFGVAYCNGRFAEPGKQAYEIFGLPADLLAGGLLQTGALLGFFGKYDEAAHLVGSGALAAYLVRQGNIMGVSHRVAKASGASVKGLFGVGAPKFYPTTDAVPAGVSGDWSNT